MKLNGTSLFPRSRHQFIYKLSENPATICPRSRLLFATTFGLQPLVDLLTTCGISKYSVIRLLFDQALSVAWTN